MTVVTPSVLLFNVMKINSQVIEEKLKEVGNDGVKYAIAELHLHSAMVAISIGAKHFLLIHLNEELQLIVLFVIVTGGAFGIKYVPKVVKKKIAAYPDFVFGGIVRKKEKPIINVTPKPEIKATLDAEGREWYRY